MRDFTGYYSHREKINLKALSEEQTLEIQRVDHWGRIIEDIIERMLKYFREFPPEEYYWIWFSNTNGRNFSRYKLASWPIYHGTYDTYKGDSGNTGHLNLLENGKLSCVVFSTINFESLWYEVCPVPLYYVNEFINPMPFNRLVIFKAMTDRALEIGVITDAERDRWSKELEGLDD